MGLRNFIARMLLGSAAMARLQIEDYGHNPGIGSVSSRDGRMDVGYDEPQWRASDAGDAAEWPDPVFDQDSRGHLITRTCPPAIIAFRKLGNRVTKLDWNAMGGNARRREQMTYLVRHTPGWSEMLRWFCWAEADGLRFCQIKALDPRFNQSQWVLPDLRGGGRLKLRAGGRLHWDGVNVYVARTANAFELKEAQIFPERNEIIVHRPGAGSSPAGDLDLGVALLNLCQSWWDGFNADKVYKLRYNQEIYRSGRGRQRPPNIQASYAAAARKVVDLHEAGPEGIIVLNDKDDIELRKLHTNGLQDLWHSMDKCAGVIYLLVVASKITSDTSDAGGVGSSGVGLSEELAAALAVAGNIAESVNMDLVPWYARMNEEMLEPLAEGEEEVYFVPEAPKAGDAGNIGDKGGDDPDGGENDEGENEDPAGDAPGEDGRKANPPASEPAALSANMQQFVAQLQVGDGAVSVVSLGITHPGCRCYIGPDNIWYDAEDARVCPVCMAMGASWNARADVPVSPEEADAALDRAKRKEVLNAIAKDSEVADKLIIDASSAADSGVVSEISSTGIAIGDGGESLTIRVEREITRRLAEARARAGVRAGTAVRGMGPVDEAIVFEREGRRMRPSFVSVNVASGQGYQVLRRRGKYLVRTLGGKTIDNVDSLALALLLFALLEKKRRDAEAEKEARERELAGV